MVEIKEKETTNPNAVGSFAIMADHPLLADLLLQSIPGCRLRSAISANKTAKNGARIGRDQASLLGQFPNLQGMELHVNPAKLTYVVLDPLAEDEPTCERIKKLMDSLGPFRTGDKLRGVPTQKGTLDLHRMKTLVREMIWLVEAGEARVVKGVLPTMDQVESLPGRTLLNAGSRVPNMQPVFEDQWDAWLNSLIRAGG